jgi:hypothetical protein
MRRSLRPFAVECKRSAATFAAQPLLAFRRQYPEGANLVVAYGVDRTFTQTYDGVAIRFVSLEDLIADIVGKTV